MAQKANRPECFQILSRQQWVPVSLRIVHVLYFNLSGFGSGTNQYRCAPPLYSTRIGSNALIAYNFAFTFTANTILSLAKRRTLPLSSVISATTMIKSEPSATSDCPNWSIVRRDFGRTARRHLLRYIPLAVDNSFGQIRFTLASFLFIAIVTRLPEIEYISESHRA